MWSYHDMKGDSSLVILRRNQKVVEMTFREQTQGSMEGRAWPITAPGERTWHLETRRMNSPVGAEQGRRAMGKGAHS